MDLEAAISRRKNLLARLQAEDTNAYRLYHGVGEGEPGLTIDRYGALILAQTFRGPLEADALVRLEDDLRRLLPDPFVFAYNHRGKTATESFELWHKPKPEALEEVKCREFGLEFLIRARHQGIDPWLFLDLRAGRRYIRENPAAGSVLNLFSYTCSMGLTAAAAGAGEVWNVDFAASNLEIGRRNAELNGISARAFTLIEEDCLPVMRQLAGLPAGGRFSQKRRYETFDAREFDLVVLDPPAWSKGAFGAIDVAGDYPSLFKPAVLAAKPGGGRVLATNHVASVELDAWIEILKRCAEKAGRPVRAFHKLAPEEDFPSFDGRHPLKIVVCEL